MTLEEDTAEEGWKDDDFLSFGGGTAEEDQAKEAEDPAEASSDPSNHAATSVPAASDLPPWMDQHTDFRRVPPSSGAVVPSAPHAAVGIAVLPRPRLS